jgi:hypothetical protein
VVAGLASCSLMKDRPVQLMSDTAAALRAAKEVSADTLAPELYRRATDAYFRANNEYRFKNFASAEAYASRAKKLAEEAEFEALKQGSNRSSLLPPDEPPPPAAITPVQPPSGRLYTEIYQQGSSGAAGGATGGSAQSPSASPTFAPMPSGSGAANPTFPSSNFTP